MNSIIAFSGLPQTGKTTLARALAKELGCKFVSFGDFVRKEAARRGTTDPTRDDLQNLGQQLVKNNVAEFCQDVLKTVNFVPGEQIVVDGVRHREVLDAISKISQNQPTKIIYLTASSETRRKRAPQEVDLDAVDTHEVESQVETDLKGLADLTIETESDMTENLRVLFNWIRSN